ncbi:MAG: hypothetical protein EOP56_10855 [Sphingobacteriales bacterium]|nr:MAG: hypothetical protein EOP56_10855 [Sphingobacteriales bacterium]
MQVFKFIFANNAILNCTPLYGRDIDGTYTYEHDNGSLTYAMVKASSEDEAYRICKRIIAEFTGATI